jgi:two-component system NarL family sensor kinase
MKKVVKKTAASNRGLNVLGYFDSIMSNISPLVTVDGALKIQYVNKPFIKTFKASRVRGRSLFTVLKLDVASREQFMQNLEKSGHASVQNCDFILNKRTYGYSMYRFADDVGIVLKDITEQKKLEKMVQSLHTRLLNLQEKERQKIAAELHDGIGQTILAAKLNFQSFLHNPENNQSRFDSGLKLIDRASEELREVYSNLYPSSLRELGLESTIRWYGRHFLQTQSITPHIKILLKSGLSEQVQVNIFRIVQEIFTNAVKHSGADRVVLDLIESQNNLNLTVSDNGHGMLAKDSQLFMKGFGFENMRRRVEDMKGTLVMGSHRGKGMKIEINIPLTKQKRS